MISDETHSANGIEKALLDKRFLKAVKVAFPTAPVAATHFLPSPIYMRTTATEEKVICSMLINYITMIAPIREVRLFDEAKENVPFNLSFFAVGPPPPT